MKSMTGFGSTKHSSPEMDLEVSIKSVNGRFLDIRMHTPKEFTEYEAELKNIVKKYILRGTVDVYVNRTYKEKGKKQSVQAQSLLAKKWLAVFKKLGKELKLGADLDLKAMIQLHPEFLTVEEQPLFSPALKKVLFDVTQTASENCQKEQDREGKALKAELERLLGQLDTEVITMNKLRDEANELLSEKYKARLESLSLGANVDPQRFHQELVIQIDKLDICEEITRLKEHSKALKALFKTQGTLGKKLDFYSQELLREVNTIGSKSQLSQLTASVVEAKSIVERFREQVQNVE